MINNKSGPVRSLNPVKFSIWDPVLREEGHSGQPAAVVAVLGVCPAADHAAFGCVEGLRVLADLERERLAIEVDLERAAVVRDGQVRPPARGPRGRAE